MKIEPFNFPLACILVALSASLNPGRAKGALISGAFTPVRAGAIVDLTTEGALDWVHWGLYTESSLNRKANVTARIGDFTLAVPSNFVGFAYQYSDNYNGYSWHDGTPVATVTDTRTGVYAVGIAHGFQVRIPAGTTVQRAKVYVGTYGARGRFQASLSDNSATAYVDDGSIENEGNGPGGVYTIDFASRSPGASLIVKWTVSLMHDPIYGNATLQAAALTSSTAENPPFVAITSPTNDATFAGPANIRIDAEALDFDGSITKVEFFEGGIKLGEDTTSPFSFDWNAVSAGNYMLSGRATDNAGNISASAPIEVFVYGSGGLLAGSVTAPPGNVNLTAEGTADWAHWGYSSSTSFNHKSRVPQQIADFTRLGDNPVERYTNNFTGFTWADGTPIEEVVDSTTGVFVTGFTNGFEITLPADTSRRTLKVYAGLYGAAGRFQAFLSDASAKAYLDTSLSNFYGDSYAVYTLSYAAASAGQTLSVRYKSRLLFDYDYGNVTLQAASLTGGAGFTNDPPTVSITRPTNSASFAAPANIMIEATASDSDGTVAKVEFFNGATRLGEDSSNPYSFAWNNVPAGTYTLTARAADNYGITATSGTVLISITNPPLAPVLIENAAWISGRFSFGFETESGRTYQVQRAESLPGQWQVLTNVTAGGAAANITDDAAPAAKRFYRVESR